MCTVLHERCEKGTAKDRSLPVNSHLVTYLLDGITTYDIVMCHKMADIFDMYWDKYREDLKKIEYTEGRTNPRLWNNKTSDKKKKK